MKDGDTFADGVKLRIWRWEDAPALLGESQGSLKVQEGGKRARVRQEFEDATLVLLKIEEGTTSQGTQAASRTEPTLLTHHILVSNADRVHDPLC